MLRRRGRTPAPSGPAAGLCSCGVYAAATQASAAAYAAQWRRGGRPSGGNGREAAVAIGAVWLWGRVIEGEGGWRASAAYPARVCLLRESLLGPGLAELRRRLEAAYGVPVEITEPGQYA